MATFYGEDQIKIYLDKNNVQFMLGEWGRLVLRIGANPIKEKTGLDTPDEITRFESGRVWCQVTLSPVVACCGSLFLSQIHSFIRKQGKATELLKHVDEFAKIGGYTQLTCIIPEANTEAVRLFTKAGWCKVKELRFKNKRSDSILDTWVKEY